MAVTLSSSKDEGLRSNGDCPIQLDLETAVIVTCRPRSRAFHEPGLKGLQLCPCARSKLTRLNALESNRSVNCRRCEVGRITSVDNNHGPARPTEHERRTQTCWSATDDYRVYRPGRDAVTHPRCPVLRHDRDGRHSGRYAQHLPAGPLQFPRRRAADAFTGELLPQAGVDYSHSIVEGGFEVMSRTTRFTPGISFTIRLEIVSSRS